MTACLTATGGRDVDYDVIVIGAGAGGLAAGATLASRGLKTVVLEQSDSIGGCSSYFEKDGFHFDVGACIVEIPRAHDWFYEGLGLKREEYVTFMRNDPLYELLDMSTGERLLVPSSIEGTADLIGRHSAKDAATFQSFIKKHGKRLDEFADVVLTTPQGRMRDLFGVFARYPKIIGSMGVILKPYGKLLDDMFEHPFSRSMLANYSIIGGLPPSVQSGLMFWLVYAEHDGMYYPRGGMGAIPRGMARALLELGGELYVGTQVSKVHLERGAARGVVLADGTVIRSRAVVSNLNAMNLYLEMIGEENIPRAVSKGLRSYDFSPSCTVGYLGLDYTPPLRAQHVFGMTSPELIDSFWFHVYGRGIPVPQSVGMVTSPSFMDPSMAPAGCGNLAFMTVAPSSPNGSDWQDIKWEYLDRGIDMVDALFVPGIKSHVVTKTIATPEDFETRLSIPHGSIYGFSMSMLSQMVFRPGNRSRCIKNLFLCGASTHTCSVPGAVCSGVIAADLACEDLERGRAA